MPLIEDHKLTKWQRRLLGAAVLLGLGTIGVVLGLTGGDYVINHSPIRVSWFGWFIAGVLALLAVLHALGVYNMYPGEPADAPDRRKPGRARGPRKRPRRDARDYQL
jgi:hypothetical protein